MGDTWIIKDYINNPVYHNIFILLNTTCAYRWCLGLVICACHIASEFASYLPLTTPIQQQLTGLLTHIKTFSSMTERYNTPDMSNSWSLVMCLGCNKDLRSWRSKYKSYGALRGCNLGVRDCLQVYCGK